MKCSASEICRQPGLAAFAERVRALMPRLMRRMLNEESNYLSRGLLTIPQLHVLLHLAGRAAATMSDVGAALCLKPSTLTGLVARLVDMGLVERRRGEEDRRAVHVAATARGRSVVADLSADRKRSIMKAFGNLTAGERAQYLDLLTKLVERMEARGACAAGPRRRRV